MYGRVFCYFCESLIDPNTEGHCSFCGGSLEMTLDRERVRRNVDFYYQSRFPVEPKDYYFYNGRNTRRDWVFSDSGPAYIR